MLFHLAWGIMVPMVFAWNTSGAHLNPVVSLVHALRKDSPFKITEFIWYMIAQILGGFAGHCVRWWYYRTPGVIDINEDYLEEAIFWETFASFILVLVTLIQTGKTTATSQHNVFNVVPIAGIYAAVYLLSNTWTMSSVNPAYGVTLNLADLADDGQDEALKYIWVYAIFPFVGGLVAWALYQFIYVPAVEEGRSGRAHV